jgi:hypothetical protein
VSRQRLGAILARHVDPRLSETLSLARLLELPLTEVIKGLTVPLTEVIKGLTD